MLIPKFANLLIIPYLCRLLIRKIMSLSYLQPVDEAFTLDDYKPQQVGFQLHKHLPSLGLPDLTDVKTE